MKLEEMEEFVHKEIGAEEFKDLLYSSFELAVKGVNEFGFEKKGDKFNRVVRGLRKDIIEHAYIFIINSKKCCGKVNKIPIYSTDESLRIIVMNEYINSS
ncbi:hypothetical protein CMI39_03065 [Candidatus Pacearchaeota archaeon]|jgi:hypothetical protein|nr:hypothetical protein [Candidatus Pacearchaeota archaeon]|tara:strand:- start:3203 stop:3502 length:300 start_codon:yes stop_codon:yes gene_type:complete